MSQKIAMITGITGQDGGYLAKFLLEKGYRVVGLYRRGSTDTFCKLKEHGIFDKIELKDFELLEFSNICRLLKNYQPDEFYNLAAQSFVAASWEEPIYTAQADGMGVAYILEAIREFSPKTKFYQASTSEMFGKVQEIPQKETTPLYPRSPYGCAKVYAHWLTTNYRESFGIFACSGILFNHESPMRGKEFVTRKISDHFAQLKLGLTDKPLELGNLDAKRDWGFAGDYVEGMWLMLQQEKPDTYILSTGETHPIRDFATLAGKYAGFDIEWQGQGVDEIGIDRKTGKTIVKVNPKFFRPAEVELLIGDPAKAHKILGWERKVSYEGLCKMMVETDIERYSKGLSMDSNKISLVFDGSILANGVTKNASRSGIYFTAYNIFKELLKREDIAITLYCDSDKFDDLKAFLKTDFPEYNFKIITNSALTGYGNLKKKKEFYKKSNRPFMKFMIQMLCLFSSPIYKLAKLFSEKDCIKSIDEHDVYLSLIFKKPKGINIKSFIMLYDLIPQLYTEYYNSQFQKGLWLYDLCKSLNNKDYYLAISEQTKQDFLKYYPVIDKKKIFTTLLACNETFKPYEQKDVDKIKEKYNIPQDKKYVFSLCTLEPRKNLIRAVKTFIEFIKKNNIEDLVFVLGGGHWEIFIEKLEQEIANLNDYSNKVIKIGYVEDEDLPILYSGAEWFTYTSMYEGFGLPPLEAMSCGCPVITSNNASLPEVVGDAGIMIDYDSDEQHIQAYEKYYFNTELKEEYSFKGLERAKLFSWKKCTNEIMEVIRNEI